MKKPFKNVAGQKFGRLVAVDRIMGPRKRWLWRCKCDCGKLAVVELSNLNSGNTTSCGCWKLEEFTNRVTKNGSHFNAEYGSWVHMKQRCLNPKHKDYKHYGGRGIKVHPAWLDDFQQFLSDVGPRPSPQHSIDRWPDKDGDYEPGNVRWATQFDQCNNARSNRLITFKGKTLNYTGWARELGVHKDLIRQRIGRGWSIERSLITPVGPSTH